MLIHKSCYWTCSQSLNIRSQSTKIHEKQTVISKMDKTEFKLTITDKKDGLWSSTKSAKAESKTFYWDKIFFYLTRNCGLCTGIITVVASNVTGENCDKLETTYVHTTFFAGEKFEWWHFDITKTHQIHQTFFSSKLHHMAYNKHGILGHTYLILCCAG